ncbi:tubulin-specific chaperone A isoform X1 [Mirounga angustirostris]|uniref:tubulin-specific chaperone A isoform X1 n=1 Tax=Mirounga angustirostris TaxID=9716 RepID=UPI00313B7451
MTAAARSDPPWARGPPTPPVGVARHQGRAGACACARGHGDYADTTTSYAPPSAAVTLALHPSIPRRPSGHGRSSREADQDQNRRGEAAEILQESRMMIPDCQRRLEAAHTDLLQLLESEKDLEETEEYKEARLVLDSVKLEA